MKKNEEQAVVTKSGYETLSKELKFLRTTRTQEVADKIEEARSHGDLSENAEYTAAKDEQAKIESRIRELENILSNVIFFSSITISRITHNFKLDIDVFTLKFFLESYLHNAHILAVFDI